MLQTLDGQRHRRFIKTHLPMDALPFYSEVSYIVVGRDLRDAAVSSHNHAVGLNNAGVPFQVPVGDEVHTPDVPVIVEDLRAYWRDYFTLSPFPWESNGWPYNSPTAHLASWWEHREEPNVIFLHYQEMLDDLDKEMRRVSAFLDIPVDEAIWPDLVKTCTFSDMKARKEKVFPAPLAESMSTFEFFHKGTNGQWQGTFTEADMALYDAAVEPLPAELRAWLTRSAR
jgi:aryl sulfotransferase